MCVFSNVGVCVFAFGVVVVSIRVYCCWYWLCLLLIVGLSVAGCVF